MSTGSQVVSYIVDDNTVAVFEIEPPAGFRQAGSDQVIGKVREAIQPAIAAARVTLDAIRQFGPQEIQLRFGVKVSGEMRWFVAKAATEGNFEVTLTWREDVKSKPGGNGDSP
jgi:hypothetical protein